MVRKRYILEFDMAKSYLKVFISWEAHVHLRRLINGREDISCGCLSFFPRWELSKSEAHNRRNDEDYDNSLDYSRLAHLKVINQQAESHISSQNKPNITSSRSQA